MKDLYVGYLPKMPKSIKSLVKPFVIILLFLGLTTGVLLAVTQGKFADSFFEFGDVKEFSGTIQAKPVPFLLVTTEKRQADGLPVIERYPLVGVGKFSVGEEVTKLDGKRVTFSAQRILRDGLRMLEVVEGTVKETGSGNLLGRARPKALGEKTLRGEIIDSKCYLGVMNPGNSKVHRACAVACLRGGVPALFVVKDKDGNKSELWLLDKDAKQANKKLLDYVAEPVELKGNITQDGDQLYFFADLDSIKRL